MKKFVVAIEEIYFRHFEVDAEDEDHAYEKVCAGEVEEVPEASPQEVNLMSIEEYEELSPENLETLKEFVVLSKNHPDNFFRNGYSAEPGLEDYFVFDQRGSDE
tara:strand:- start:257 stop:568 length:312 start_codon:yes stop_codon:yes gene_type:complete